MVHDAAHPEPPVEEAAPAEAASAPSPDPELAALLAAERVANDYHPGRGD
jgi:hypothetical protein